MRAFPGWILVAVLVTGCSKPGGESAASTASSHAAAPSSAQAVSSSKPSASSASAASTSSAAASSAASASGGAHLASLAVCNLVVSAHIAKVCEAMPSPGGGADASQFTMPGTPAHKGALYGGVFTYSTAADFDADLKKFKSEEVGKKRAAPIFLSNANALTIVVSDGEIGSADVDGLKKIVDALR